MTDPTQFKWEDAHVFALVEKVARDGKKWNEHRSSANEGNGFHGMSRECVLGDRMKQKWALLKRYPSALLRKSKEHYDLFVAVESQRRTDNQQRQPTNAVQRTPTKEAFNSPVIVEAAATDHTASMHVATPIMPNETPVRRVPRPERRRVSRAKLRVVSADKPKNRYPPKQVCFKAKYDSGKGGGCSICKRPISKGQMIHNTGTSQKADWTHATCETVD